MALAEEPTAVQQVAQGHMQPRPRAANLLDECRFKRQRGNANSPPDGLAVEPDIAAACEAAGPVIALSATRRINGGSAENRL